MSSTIDRLMIEKLSVEQRFELIEMILETLAEKGAIPPLGPTWEEIERRAEEARANPDDGMSLEEFKARLQERRR